MVSEVGKTDDCVLIAIRDKVVVQPVETDKQKHGPSVLIVTTSDAIDDVKRGRIVSVGEGFVTPDGERIPLTLQVGDLVIFPKDAGKTVWSYGSKYLILREQEVLAVER